MAPALIRAALRVLASVSLGQDPLAEDIALLGRRTREVAIPLPDSAPCEIMGRVLAKRNTFLSREYQQVYATPADIIALRAIITSYRGRHPDAPKAARGARARVSFKRSRSSK